MKKLFLQVFFTLFSIQIIAQADTIFYNPNWQPCSKDTAHFYRPLPFEKVGELFLIQDYYINGNLQFKGYSIHPDREVFQGTNTWFFPNGKKKQEVEYKNRRRDGNFITYHPDGSINTSCIYKNNRPWEGDFQQDYYSAQGHRMGYHNFSSEVQRYKKGKMVYEFSRYENSKQLAFEVFHDIKNTTTHSKYYQKDGTKIGEITFNQGFENGIHVEFYRKETALTITGIFIIYNYQFTFR